MDRHAIMLACNIPARDLDSSKGAHHHGAALPIAVAVDLKEHLLDFKRVASHDKTLVVRHATFKRHFLCAEGRFAPSVQTFIGFDLYESPIRPESIKRVDFNVCDFHKVSR